MGVVVPCGPLAAATGCTRTGAEAVAAGWPEAAAMAVVMIACPAAISKFPTRAAAKGVDADALAGVLAAVGGGGMVGPVACHVVPQQPPFSISRTGAPPHRFSSLVKQKETGPRGSACPMAAVRSRATPWCPARYRGTWQHAIHALVGLAVHHKRLLAPIECQVVVAPQLRPNNAPKGKTKETEGGRAAGRRRRRRRGR